jgi:hypothetical protein
MNYLPGYPWIFRPSLDPMVKSKGISKQTIKIGIWLPNLPMRVGL